MAEKVSKTQTSFYRRLYVAHLIDSGISTVPEIIKTTGMPRRTVQDTISALREIGVQWAFVGATKNGEYRITDWGPINRGWVINNLQHITGVLECR